ncbi:MAG: MobA/MobL family protein, partial [Anaeromassilibacillus sp.]
EVEKAERGKKAQLAYSFDIALQNEFSMQENIGLARQFLLEQFVSRGMVVDFSVHAPDKEDSGIANPHFHVMCPIRPLLPDGKWGNKQRREYLVDENGERIRDEAGNYVFNAVPTTDWGAPTLSSGGIHGGVVQRQIRGERFDCRIDHRSYERQGVEC